MFINKSCQVFDQFIGRLERAHAEANKLPNPFKLLPILGLENITNKKGEKKHTQMGCQQSYASIEYKSHLATPGQRGPESRNDVSRRRGEAKANSKTRRT